MSRKISYLADCEAIPLDRIKEVWGIYQKKGYAGVLEFVQELRGGPEKSPFIEPVQKWVEANNKE